MQTVCLLYQNNKILTITIGVLRSSSFRNNLTITMTMTTLLLNINTGYKLEYTYNMIYSYKRLCIVFMYGDQ